MSASAITQPTDINLLCEAHYHFLSLWPGYGREDWAGAAFISNDMITMPFRNHVALVRSQLDDVPALIEHANTLFPALGALPAFQLDRATTPVDLPDHLMYAGYHKQAEEIWMLCSIAATSIPPTPPHIAIEQLTSASPEPLIEAYIQCFTTSFGVSDSSKSGFDRSFRGLLPNPAGLHFLALLGGQPAGAITLMHDAAFGGVYNVGTFPGMRGQGIASALLLNLLRVARQLGLTQLLLQTLHHGPAQPIYERVGFRGHFIRDWYLPAPPQGIWSR